MNIVPGTTEEFVDTTYPLGQNPTLARQYLYNIRAEYVDNVSDNVSKHIDIGWPIPQNLVVDLEKIEVQL